MWEGYKQNWALAVSGDVLSGVVAWEIFKYSGLRQIQLTFLGMHLDPTTFLQEADNVGFVCLIVCVCFIRLLVGFLSSFYMRCQDFPCGYKKKCSIPICVYK